MPASRTLDSADPDQCVITRDADERLTAYGDAGQDLLLAAGGDATFAKTLKLINEAVKGINFVGEGSLRYAACLWRVMILHRLYISRLPTSTPSSKIATELDKQFQLYDLIGTGEEDHTTRGVKREAMKTLAIYSKHLPISAWDRAVSVLRTQTDSHTVKWAIIAIQKIMMTPTARENISMSARDLALIEIGRIATSSADPDAPSFVLTTEPEQWFQADPISGFAPIRHGYAQDTIYFASSVYSALKHAQGNPCDPTAPPTDIAAYYACWPELAPVDVDVPPSTAPPSATPPGPRHAPRVSFAWAAARPAALAAGTLFLGLLGFVALGRR